MNPAKYVSFLAAFLAALTGDLASASPSSEVLFDYTVQTASGGLATGSETGHSILLAHPVAITELAIAVTTPSNYPEDYRVRIYAGASLHGPPGQLLWTGDYEDIPMRQRPTLVTFDVPHVVVPALFTWTVEQTGNDYGLLLHGVFPPAPGGNFGTAGGWIYRYEGRWVTSGVGAELSTRVSGYAIPEPSTLALAAMLTFSLVGRRC